MFSGDLWIRDLSVLETDFIQIAENLRRRDQHQKGSRAFIRSNREIKEKLENVKEQLQELSSLLNQQSITGEITEAEATRRLSLLRRAEARHLDLENQSKTNPRENYFRKELLGDAPQPEQTVSWGEAGDDNVGTGEERIQAQQQYMKDQDAGLDQLAAIMSRTKNLAQEFTTEIDLHNEIIDDVGERMESVNARLIHNTQRTRQLVYTTDTCGLWVIVIALMIAIIIVAII
ncbi:syntaxin-8 [Galendromus occidentalis]|uniref:Syntaxin-8 n=1 Tax=Galendromus occidentalis TaxID=34638 RepID=A0AAJ6VXV0_9ACAR|nr:syntaxin-8 [Galendromus occidentalis]